MAIHGGIKTYIEEFQPQILDREEHMREQDGPASIRIDYCNWIEIFIDFLIWRPEGKWIIEWNREEGVWVELGKYTSIFCNFGFEPLLKR